MSADILDGLERFANGGYGDWSTVASKAIARIQLDAAEIGRLRGEVAALLEDPDEAELAYRCGDPDSDAIAPAEAKDPAPAMPNGVEGLVQNFLDKEVHPTVRDWENRNLAGISILKHWRDFLISLTRAADNRDAAGVDDATFAEWLATEMPAGTVIGNPEWWANRIARQYRVRNTPAAVPAGEAVARGKRDTGISAAVDRGDLRNTFAPQPADGEAVAWVCSPAENIAQHVGINSEERQKLIDAGFDVSHYRPLVYGDTTPPAAQVQQPDERELSAARSAITIAAMEWGRSLAEGGADYGKASAFDDAVERLERAAGTATHPAAGDKVRELVQRWRGYGKDCGVSQVWGKCANELEAALQHRGDSRGGEG